ncbi:MAG: elongation factor G [Coriobacteriia bacterium]|nr:elongation factor G [Coriobacteriia bacterium]
MADAAGAKLRNVVLVGHGGAGTTSLAEALLHYTKATPRLGNVDAGQSNLDYDSEEIERKFTINLSLAPLTYKGVKVNLIDTPGYADFIGDAIAGMRAAEIALFVVDAVGGPQVTTDRLWQIAGEMGIPRAIFVNRMDKEHADYSETFAKLRSRYGKAVVPVQIPIGAEENLEGVVDVIRQQAFYHKDPEKACEIPADMQERASKAREALVDSTADADEELMMKYLEGEEITLEELDSLLGVAVTAGTVVPVFAGSAAKMAGIDDLLQAIVDYFPKPGEGPKFPLADGSDFDASTASGFTGFVFKTLSDPYVGRLSFVKVLSGSVKDGDDFIDSRTGDKERASHVVTMVGKETKSLTGTVATGDIVVLPKLGSVLTNDTLSTTGKVALAPMPFPEALYPVAIVAKTKADEDKLGTALKTIVEENPTVELERNEETHQTVLKTYGDTAVDVIVARLKDRYHVETELDELRIPYRETIRKVAQAQGRHKKQSGGSGQFGDCWLRLEPNPGGGFEFLDEVVGGRIPRQFIPAVDRGVQETMTQGVIAGYPVVDVKVAVYDGSYHAVDSNEMAFRSAARIGFRAAAALASPVILEPMASLTITVPDEYAGAVMGDISSLRGRVLGMGAGAAGMQEIKAMAPYAEVANYSPHLRSLSHGTGIYTIELEGYEQVPGEVQKQLIADYEASRAHD